MESQVSNFVTYQQLVWIVLGSSGLLALLFSIISRLFDKSLRVSIMEEIERIDIKYQKELDKIKEEMWIELESMKREVGGVKLNYLDRFAEQKDLIVSNKEMEGDHHSTVMQILTEIKGDVKYLHNKS